jgi:hypothetical protein
MTNPTKRTERTDIVKKFRKKPVVIEAIQWIPHFPKPNHSNFEEIKELVGNNCSLDKNYGLIIQTLEGDMQAQPLDWIIKGVNGEFYPCKPDIFEKTYEPI